MAPSDRPGANSRGRGGKFRKFTRGGGKQFSRDLRPVDADGNPISMWSADAQKQFAEGEDEDEDDDDDEEDSDSDDGAAAAKGEPSRADRKQDKKARKEAAIKKKAAQNVQVGDLPPSDSDDSDEDSDDDMPANPNHSKAARSMTKAPVAPAAAAAADVDGAADGVKGLAVTGTPNRRERESMEAAQAKERYRKLHEQGKTDEAKADMARLKLIREQREAEAARRQAEKEEREAQEKARKDEIEKKEAKKREAALGSAKKTKKTVK